MKKLIFTICSLIISAVLFSQTIVNTSVDNRKAVLGEFTGIHCVYCPEGHLIAHNLATANPGDFFAINYHYGGYAVPSGSEPDYRTVDGDIVGGFFGPTAFPTGMMNRQDFGSGIITSRSAWTGNANTVMAENSYVNVGIEAEYNSTTNLMTVHVEVYYTGNSPVSTNYLSVALLQNNIVGPQTGGTSNPYGDNGDGTYTHQHMFRDMINNALGEPINTTTTGSFIDKYYYYLVPSDINGVNVVPADLEIVAFVHETESNIESANGCTPTITSTVTSLDAVNAQVTTPAILCGDLSPEVTILNNGSANITNVQFSYNVNGGTSQNHTWTGNLATGQSTIVTLPVIAFSSLPLNSCNVSITSVNGGTDNNIANNNGSSTFETAMSGITTTVYLDLLTDNYGYETTWELYDEFGTIVYQSSGTYANNTQYNHTFNLTPGCYNFVIHDDYGDGMCCSYGNGHYILTDATPITIKNGGAFGAQEETPFMVGVATTPPTAAFSAGITSICAGSSISFTDNSSDSPTSWSWNFGGGAANSTVQNPTVTFNTPGIYSVSLTATNAGGSDTDTQTNLITVYANPTASASSTNVNCFGINDGTATVNAGGTSGYTYLWSPGGGTTSTITGLGAGTYNVTVTDINGCIATASTSLTSPTSSLLASISNFSDPLCNGDSNGSATASGNGGTSGYTYIWQGGATTATVNGLADGTYNVTVTDANGCTANTSVTITEPTPVNAFVSVTDVSCYNSCDGVIVGIASGGNPGYSYSWSGGLVGGTHSGLCANTYNLTVTDGNGCTDSNTGIVNQPTQIVLTPSSTSATCTQSDGSATVSATGGAGNYTYSWQGGQTTSTITGIASGTYNVTVTDITGCTNNISVNVSDIGGATLNSSSVPALCYNSNDGSASVVATGGTPGYSYLWSSGGTAATENGLAGGIYTVTVTDGSGCNTTEVINVSAPTQMTGSIGIMSNVTCFGMCDGSATTNISGGTPNYSFEWSSGGTNTTEYNLCVGSIALTVTDANGCVEVFNSSISSPTELTSSITSSTDPLCNGGTDGEATVSANGGTPNYTYNWSSGGNSTTETGLGDGTYSVTVTDNKGCTSSQTVTITEPTAIVITPSSTDENPQGANNGTATASPSGGTSPYIFSWDNGGDTQTITGLASGTYYVTVTDANGCSETSSIFVDFFVSISEMDITGFSYSIFPNPTDRYINLEIVSDIEKDMIVRVLNNTGQLIIEQKFSNIIGEYRHSIDVSKLASGIYEIVIITDDGMINKKIIKK